MNIFSMVSHGKFSLLTDFFFFLSSFMFHQHFSIWGILLQILLNSQLHQSSKFTALLKMYFFKLYFSISISAFIKLIHALCSGCCVLSNLSLPPIPSHQRQLLLVRQSSFFFLPLYF